MNGSMVELRSNIVSQLTSFFFHFIFYGWGVQNMLIDCLICDRLQHQPICMGTVGTDHVNRLMVLQSGYRHCQPYQTSVLLGCSVCGIPLRALCLVGTARISSRSTAAATT